MLTAQQDSQVRRICDEANALLGKMWAEMEVDRAKANPKGLYFPKGSGYRYYSIKTGKKRTVKGVTFTPEIRFCRTVHANHAGYWVAWVDTVQANGKVKRSGWTFNRSKQLVMEHSREEYQGAKAKRNNGYLLEQSTI